MPFVVVEDAGFGIPLVLSTEHISQMHPDGAEPDKWKVHLANGKAHLVTEEDKDRLLSASGTCAGGASR